ncbi:MAG: hypothetical protein QOE93_970, partial [Actinomycetota bacterium]|nr:hypothetical protein [Actinomycetota bacterium]
MTGTGVLLALLVVAIGAASRA